MHTCECLEQHQPLVAYSKIATKALNALAQTKTHASPGRVHISLRRPTDRVCSVQEPKFFR